MGFFDKFRKEEQRSDEPIEEVQEAISLDGHFKFGLMTEERAMSIPAVKTCVDLISGSVAQMPIKLYKEDTKDGSIEPVYGDKRLRLLNEEANDFLNGYNLKKNMVKDYLLEGGSYTHLYKTSHVLQELHPIPARSIVIEKYVSQGYRTTRADITVANTEGGAINHTTKRLPKFKAHHLIIALQESHDGLSSKGALEQGEQIFRQALAEMEYTSSIYENGALPLGILKTDSRLNEGAITKLRTAWQRLYGGVKNSAKTVVLQEGMDYQPLSMKPQEMQMTDTKKATVAEICKVFNIPENLVNVQAGKVYVSIEQNNLHFLKTTLQPIIAAFEAAINRALLLESEKDAGYFFRFDTSELVRATEKERVETVVRGIQGGLYSRHEGRSKMDLPAIGEDVFIELPGATTSNTNAKGEQSDEPVETDEPEDGTSDN